MVNARQECQAQWSFLNWWLDAQTSSYFGLTKQEPSQPPVMPWEKQSPQWAVQGKKDCVRVLFSSTSLVLSLFLFSLFTFTLVISVTKPNRTLLSWLTIICLTPLIFSSDTSLWMTSIKGSSLQLQNVPQHLRPLPLWAVPTRTAPTKRSSQHGLRLWLGSLSPHFTSGSRKLLLCNIPKAMPFLSIHTASTFIQLATTLFLYC